MLLILATVAAIAAPRYAQALAGQRLAAAARRVAADLLFAKRQAKHTGSSRTVSFNVGANRYDVSDEEDLDHPGQPYRVFLDHDPYQAVIVSADFGGDAAIVFDGYGEPDTGGFVTIQVGSKQGTISVDLSTGGVSPPVIVPIPELPDPPQTL